MALADRPMACHQPGQRPPRELLSCSGYTAPAVAGGWRAMRTLVAVTEARLALGRRLAILRPDAGALNPIQFRPAAADQPIWRAGPLSWSAHHGESVSHLYWRLPVSFRSPI